MRNSRTIIRKRINRRLKEETSLLCSSAANGHIYVSVSDHTKRKMTGGYDPAKVMMSFMEK